MENGQNILQEWAPMTEFINRIPVKVQSGLFAKLVSLTCVDAIPEFLTLGTNIGVLYWFNRKSGELEKLKCDAPEITCVKIVNTVEYMVACGHTNGQITIFQIPKSHPDTLPKCLRPINTKKIERYTITEIHASAITTLEWSPNGMKLFSGDKNGLVVLSELDFNMHICREFTVVNESYEVIQLCYCQQQLLISTTYRSIICQYSKPENKWKVCQVGKKDRKSLGHFGGLIWKVGLKPTDVIAYCCRPGLRIWIADSSGTVQKTLLFKDLINNELAEIPLLNPVSSNIRMLKSPENEPSFGMLIPFEGKYLVTHDSNMVYILDPENLAVIGVVRHLRSILSISCTKDEIFILEGGRSLIRLASYADVMEFTNEIPSGNSFLPISDSLKDITSKFNTTSIIAALPTILDVNITECAVQTDDTAVMNAEEAQESPSPQAHNETNFYDGFLSNDDDEATNLTQKLVANSQNIAQIVANLITQSSPCDKSIYVSTFESPRHVPFVNGLPQPSEESLRKLELFEKIGEENFDNDILYKHYRRKKNKKRSSDMSASMTSSCGSDQTPKTSPLKINLSNPPPGGVSVSIQPDLRSPDSIQRDIKTKEELLSDYLYFKTEAQPVDQVAVDDLSISSNYKNGATYKEGKVRGDKIPVENEEERKPNFPIWITVSPPERTSSFNFMKRKKPNGIQNVSADCSKDTVKPSTSYNDTSDIDLDFATKKKTKKQSNRKFSTSQENADNSDVSLTDWEIIENIL